MSKKAGRCIAFYAFNSTGKITPVPCGKWSCEHCAKDNARMWAWRVRLQLDNDDRQYYFWTFTLGSKYKNAKQGFTALPRLWDGLRKAIVRHIQKSTGGMVKKWTYCAFVEGQTKRGNMPHFHVLSSIPSPYRIKDFAVHQGFGYQAKQEKIEGTRAQNYVAKYVSKGNADMPKNFRRCRVSQDWSKLPPYQGSTLYVKSKSESITAFLIRVSDQTGKDIDDLWEQWQWAHEID